MTLALAQSSPEPLYERPRKLVPRILALLFFTLAGVFMVAGIGSFTAAYLRSNDMPDGFAWKSPADQVSPGQLDPAVALLVLTDATADDTLDQTFEAGDLESAYALVAYDPRLSDPARVGALLQLGSQYSAAKNLRRAAWSYEGAALLAILSPMLSDFSRTETLLTASAGLRAADAKDAARRALDQANLIAVYSPALRRQQRASRLNQIANAYDSLNLAGIADQARNKAQEAASAPETLVNPRTPFIPIPGSLPVSTSLAQLKHRRAAAASQLIDDVAIDKPKSLSNWPQDSLNQLKYALLQEDDARTEYYTQQFPAARDSFAQIALLLDKANWLALKYRAARGGFGAMIVPEWTKNSNSISDDLSDTWLDVYRVFQSQTDALSSVQDVNQAAEDILKQELIAARWGWSQQLEPDLRDALAKVTTRLHDGSVPALRLDSVSRNNRTLFLLVPDELVGRAASGLPQ